MAAGQQQQGVAVGRRTGRDLGADIAGGARLVLDDELLAEPAGQPLAAWRAATSGALPAMKGTMMRTGLSGYSACAVPAANSDSAAASRTEPAPHWKRFSSACQRSFSNRLQSWPWSSIWLAKAVVPPVVLSDDSRSWPARANRRVSELG